MSELGGGDVSELDGMVFDAERRARIAFARLTEPCAVTARREVSDYGHVQALERLQAGVGPLVSTAGRRLSELDLDREERATRLCGARVLVPSDDEWPQGLNDLEHPPHCLWVRGSARLDVLADRGIAVVGARGSSAYGDHVAAELGFALTSSNHVVVSGAAYGIDAAAHRGALAADGPTLAALACGIDRAYPAAHGALLTDIARDGAVVTEAPPGAVPLRSRFLARNRLIAALSAGTVVVEAGVRSGSLNTANWAQAIHRYVAAIPGPVTAPTSAGTHRLIREGAALVTDAQEVIELMGRMGDLAPLLRGREEAHDQLEPAQFAVWEALSPRTPAPGEQLAAAAGVALPQVHTALAELEALGMAAQDLWGWRRC